MRIDDVSPRTWLLGGVAGWALLAWVLALAGMGTRIEALPDDPSLLRPLPPLRAPTPERLGPLAQYGEIAARPLFSTDRRPKPFSLQGAAEGEGAAQAFDFQLTSVLITPGLQVAILQPPDGSRSVRVRLGDALEANPGWRLVELNARSAVFDGPEGRRSLDLRVFDGQGGQAPTPIATGMPLPPGRPGEGVPAQGAAVPPPRPIVDAPRPVPAPGTVAPATAAPPGANGAAGPQTNSTANDQAQMEAIRQRIQARREQLRQQQNQPQQPPAQ